MSERHTLTESVDQALIGMVADNRLPAEDYHKVHDILTGKVIVYDNTFEEDSIQLYLNLATKRHAKSVILSRMQMVVM